jgi:5-methylcytosine-specific restriction endonuclease McrA
MAGVNKTVQRVRTRLFHAQRGLCYYCNRPMLLAKGPSEGRQPPHLCTLDHIIPLSRGGAFAPTQNAVAACAQCNNDRGDTDARMFMLQKQGVL